jgi:hypothetical protein
MKRSVYLPAGKVREARHADVGLVELGVSDVVPYPVVCSPLRDRGEADRAVPHRAVSRALDVVADDTAFSLEYLYSGRRGAGRREKNRHGKDCREKVPPHAPSRAMPRVSCRSVHGSQLVFPVNREFLRKAYHKEHCPTNEAIPHGGGRSLRFHTPGCSAPDSVIQSVVRHEKSLSRP